MFFLLRYCMLQVRSYCKYSTVLHRALFSTRWNVRVLLWAKGRKKTKVVRYSNFYSSPLRGIYEERGRRRQSANLSLHTNSLSFFFFLPFPTTRTTCASNAFPECTSIIPCIGHDAVEACLPARPPPPLPPSHRHQARSECYAIPQPLRYSTVTQSSE